MSYSQDYDNRNMKIPYDDIPISRRPSVQRSRGGTTKVSLSGFRALAICVAVLLIVNIGLIVMLVYHMNNSVMKQVNVNNISIDASQNVSASVAAASKTKWSSVCVAAGGTAKDEEDFLTSMESRGSGIIYEVDEVNKAVYFVTCYHVIRGYEDSVYVLLPSQLQSYKVEVLSYSAYYDLAVLKLNRIDILDDCKKVTVADSALVAQGEPVFACGNPLSDGLKITSGIISSVNSIIRVENNDYDTRVFQTDVAINPGNSGGGLFDSEGNFIGIVNSKLMQVKVGTSYIDVDGQSYAIPGNFVCGFANNAIKNDKDGVDVTNLECFDLGATFAHKIEGGRTSKLINNKFIDVYMVEVVYTVPASPASGRFSSSEPYTIIEYFEYTNVYGEKKKVEMYNKYSFDDVIFDIQRGSVIHFYCTNKSSPIEIVANNFVNVEN